MKYKDFKLTDHYLSADILEVYSDKTGEEFPFTFPEAQLDEMEVVNLVVDSSGYVSVTLKEEA